MSKFTLSTGKKSHIRKIAETYGTDPSKFNDVTIGFIAKDAGVPRALVAAFLKPDSYEAKQEHIQLLERRLLEKEATASKLQQRHKSLMVSENQREVLRETLSEFCTPMRALPSQVVGLDKRKKGSICEDLVMHISDEHADQVVLPHRVNGLENYNLGVALRRAETYVQKALQFTQETLSNYNFGTLWVLKYGDHVNGAIHGGTETSSLRNDFANALAVGQMQALMVRDMAPFFERVVVVSVPGNHGRQSFKKDYANALRNLDYLVAESAAMMCKDIPNVEHIIPDSHSINLNINGFNFNVSHGDDVSGNAGTPWYGIERRNNRIQAIHSAKGERIHYKVMGHFHKGSMTQDHSGEFIVNGSWKATDEWSYNAIGGYCEPIQWIHGVNPEHGITWRLPVHLRTKGDDKGPERYKLLFANQLVKSQMEALQCRSR